jgi:hypothetical protein
VYHDVTNVVPVNQPPTAKYAVGNNNKPDQPTKTIYLSLTNHLQDQTTFLVLPNSYGHILIL